jgi:hypothetical protein
MPERVLKMLNNLIDNGSDDDLKVIGEGVKASLEILSEIQPAMNSHINDKELHTPKGILVRTKVIGWLLFIMIIVSTIVAYLPEKIAMLSP